MAIKIRNSKCFKILLGVVMLLSVIMTVAFYKAPTTASANTDTLSTVTMTMRKGASIRVSGELGLRFSFTMPKSQYDDLLTKVGEDKEYTDLYFGMLIAPVTYTDTEGYEFSYENLFGTTPKYDWADKDGNYTEHTGAPYRIINLYGSDFMADLAEEDKVEGESQDPLKVFSGSVINMKPQNLLTDYNGIGYACVTLPNGQVEYKLATPNDNERSVVYVAQKAIDDDSEFSTEIAETYLTSDVLTTKVDVTCEYYLEQADGSFVKSNAYSETIKANVNSTATITEKTIDGYKFDSANAGNVLEGKTYANGSTVLKRYYKVYLGEEEGKTLTKMDLEIYNDNGSANVVSIPTSELGFSIKPADYYWAKIAKVGGGQTSVNVTVTDGAMSFDCSAIADNTYIGDCIITIYTNDRGNITQPVNVVTKKIKTAEQFMAMDNAYGNTGSGNYTGYFVLANDIDFGGEAYSNTTGTFIGTLDGNGYAIKNFKITGNNLDHHNTLSGLFGSIAAKGVVKNLTIKDFDINPQKSGDSLNLFGNSVFGTVENVDIIITDADFTSKVHRFVLFGYGASASTVLKDINIFFDIPNSKLYSEAYSTLYLFTAFTWDDNDATTVANNMSNVNVVSNLTALAGSRNEILLGATNNFKFGDGITVSDGTATVMSKSLPTGMTLSIVEQDSGITVDGNTITVTDSCMLTNATLRISWVIGGETVTKDIAFDTGVTFPQVDLTSQTAFSKELYETSTKSPVTNADLLSYISGLGQNVDGVSVLSVKDATTDQAVDLSTFTGCGTWLVETSNRSTYKINVEVATKFISTAQEFMDMDKAYGNNSTANHNYTGYFVLTNDIDFGGASFMRDYDNTSNVNTFNGIFDGKGYALYGFKLLCHQTGGNPENSAGLFGVISSKAVVRNLTVKGFDIDVAKTYSFNLLARKVSGTMENINVIIKASDITTTSSVWNFYIMGREIEATAKFSNINVFTDLPSTFCSGAGVSLCFGWNDTDATTLVNNNSTANINVISCFNSLSNIYQRNTQFESITNNLYFNKLTVVKGGSVNIMSKGLVDGLSFAVKSGDVTINGNTLTADAGATEAVITMSWNIGGETVTKDITVTIS